MIFFLSVPMKDKSKEEITDIRVRLVQKLQKKIGEYDTIEIRPFRKDWITDTNIKHKEVYLIGESLEQMAEADKVVMAKDWDKYSGCIIENRTAMYYNIPIIYEEDL